MVKVGRRLALSNKVREPKVESFGADESGTTKRDYPPGFVEGMQTTRIPRGDLEALLRRESGTRQKVTAEDLSELAERHESGTHARVEAPAPHGPPAGSIATPTPLVPVVVPPASLVDPTSETRDSALVQPASPQANRAEPTTELDAPTPSLEHRALLWSMALVGMLAFVAGVVAFAASRH